MAFPIQQWTSVALPWQERPKSLTRTCHFFTLSQIATLFQRDRRTTELVLIRLVTAMAAVGAIPLLTGLGGFLPFTPSSASTRAVDVILDVPLAVIPAKVA